MKKLSHQETLREYGRGIIGGILFSLPLLYTMEVWWTGFIAPPKYLLACIFVTFLLLLGYNRYAGIKEEATLKEITWESLEEIGLGFVVSFLFLLLISKIDFQMSFDEIAGRVIVETMIVAIGISVGTAQLGQGKGDGKKGHRDKKEDSLMKIFILSFCGAVLFSSSMAPTEEILVIALESTYIDLLSMVIISLLIGAIVLYFSDFTGTTPKNTEIEKALLHLLIGYLAALIVSFVFLWFFGRVINNSFDTILAQIIVLSIPGVIGASAGRLLIAK